VSERIINRFLELSFERGYFKGLRFGESKDTISLATAPIVIAKPSSPASSRLLLKVDALYRTQDRLTRLVAFKDALRLSFDLELRLAKSEKGVKLVLESIDTASVRIDRGTLRRGFRKLAIKKIRQAIDSANEEMRRNETLLTDEVPIPSSLYGQRLELDRIETGAGKIQLYMNLGDHQF
jgi:hypothetical protein